MRTTFSLLLCLAALPAQTPNRPFTLIGFIEEFKLLGASAVGREDLQPALLRVQGINVLVPENLIIQMPGSYLTAADIFRGPQATPAAAPGAASGLALNDTPKPRAPYEASIIGNIVNGEYIAGMVNISQHSLASGEGIIAQILPSGAGRPTEELIIRSGTGNQASEVRLRLNDPNGRFSRGHSDDVRFSADDENPTIAAETGFPVCVPAGPADPHCPAKNRPVVNGRPLQRFVAGPVPVFEIDPKHPCRDCAIPVCSACNPRLPVPLRAGDHIVYEGTLSATDPKLISVHTLTANLAVYTSPGASPAYVAIEMSRYGTGGVTFPGLPQEQGFGKKLPAPATTTNIKIEGMTTDPSRKVSVYAVDKNAAGVETLRFLQDLTPAGIPLGRWRQVLDSANQLPPTRELRAVVKGEPVAGVPGSIRGKPYQLGIYQAPVEEFIFPEGTVPGLQPVPMNFESLCFLLNGAGQLETLGRANGPLVQGLKPFPFSGTPPMAQFDAKGNRICATP